MLKDNKNPIIARLLAGLFLVFCAASRPALSADSPGAPDPQLTAPKLGLPLLCRPGATCWLVNLIDHDPGPGVRDYACGGNTYNGHTGVDFALRDYSVMDDGVPVVAAAAGTVGRLRDGVLDGNAAFVGRAALGKQQCGNSVSILHANGWRTLYCHLRRNSVIVRPGQRVEKGEKLGLVGSSGLAEFPHVHLSVFHDEKVVDPFVGLERKSECGPGLHPLWDGETARLLRGPLTAIYDGGFAPNEINSVALHRGFYRTAALSAKSPFLVFWVSAFWVRAGDRLTMKITAPDGRVVLEKTHELIKTQAEYWQMLGKRRIADWHVGAYKGEALLQRTTKDGKLEKFTLERRIRIEE